MKKYFRICGITFMMMLILGTSSYAKREYLWKATNTTYVETSHPDNYFADEYVGYASVRGADRVMYGGKNYYFKWTKITYDVQGDKISRTSYSEGKNDTSQRIVRLDATDKWNLNPTKTKAYYSYEKAVVDGSSPGGRSRSSNKESSIVNEGLLDRTIVEPGIVLNEGVDTLKR